LMSDSVFWSDDPTGFMMWFAGHEGV
jgi:hypothetical protein